MPSHASPTPLSGRALAPDLARGMMLLFIALAHAPWFLYTSPVGVSPMHPADGNLADHLAQALTIVMVDGRTHTMFGLLFAYGIGRCTPGRQHEAPRPVKCAASCAGGTRGC